MAQKAQKKFSNSLLWACVTKKLGKKTHSSAFPKGNKAERCF
jgi:hypothetical protein